jgi:ABC-type multidrug transport system fused ATPase/permease subunit
MKNTDKKSKKISVNSLRHVVNEILAPRYKRLLLGLLLVILSRVASLVLPGATKYLIDEVFIPKNLEPLNGIVLIAMIAVVVQATTGFALVKVLGIEAQYLIKELRLKVHNHILKLPLNYFSNEKSGTIVARIMNDVEGVRNLIGTGLSQLIGGLLTAIMAFVILMKINTSMTLYSVLAFFIFGFVMAKAFQIIRPILRLRSKINAEVTGRLTETIGGMKIIKGFAAEDREREVFDIGVQSLYENVKKSMTASALVTMVTLLLTGFVTSLVMYKSAYSVTEGDMSTGDFVAYLLYLGIMAFPVVQMSNIGTQITEAFAGLDRMQEILEIIPEGNEEDRTVELKELKGSISFKNVDFSYDDTQVLTNVSFDARPGEVVALVGSSGSGKSTLVSLLAGLYKLQNGKIEIDGISIAKLKFKSYRSKLAMVLQDDFLFDGTLKENLMFSKPEATPEELQNAVEKAYVNEFSDKLPDGLDTFIGERGVKLSGGQKQRVSIARAILANPALLILDEATSALDNESERMVQDSLEDLLKDRTTIVIAHRLSTIRRAHKILVIEEGQILEQGTHKELLAKEGRYADLHNYQARI